MFSVGCLLHFSLTKDNLFGDSYHLRDCNVIERHYNLRKLDHMEEAKDLIKNLLDPDSTMRRSSSQVLQHPFLWDFEKQINFFSYANEFLHGYDRRGWIADNHDWDFQN